MGHRWGRKKRENKVWSLRENYDKVSWGKDSEKVAKIRHWNESMFGLSVTSLPTMLRTIYN